MKKINPTLESAPNAENYPSDLPAPSLNELISEIDSEIGPAPAPIVAAETQNEKTTVSIGYGDRQYIRFSLNDTRLALPLSQVLEIGYLPDVTPLPNLPDWILGVCNIRGEIVSMVDLKVFLGMPDQEAKRYSRFIITGNGQLKLALAVDRIMGLLHMDRLQVQIQAAPYSENEIAPFIKGVVVEEKRLLNILDVDKLLSAPKMVEV